MKKKTVLLLLCVTIATCLIGCEEKQEKKEPTKTEQTVSEDTKTSEGDNGKEEVQTEQKQEVTKVVENEKEDTTKNETPKETGNKTQASTTGSQKQNESQSTQTTPTTPTTESPKVETPTQTPEVPKATANDSVAVANQVLAYINSYRNSPATKLPGLTRYAEYRSRQLISNFAHDTTDERAAATALQYGSYIDPPLYGMTGEPYYEAGAREAIAKGGYVGTIDEVAQRLATLVRNSAGHWAYVGSSEYPYIAVGVTYESGMWYCDIAMARVNTDNN